MGHSRCVERNHKGPTYLGSESIPGQKQQRLRTVISCKRQRGVPPEGGWKESCPNSGQVFCPTALHSPSWGNVPASLNPWPGKLLNRGTQWQRGLEQSLVGSWWPLLVLTQEGPQKPPRLLISSHSTTANLLIYAKSTRGPHQPCRVVSQNSRGRGNHLLVRDKGKSHLNLCLSTAMETYTGSTLNLCWNMSLLPSALPSSGAKVRVQRERKSHTWKEQSHLKFNPLGFCSRSMGSDSALDWAVMAASRQEVWPHTSTTTASGIGISSPSPSQGESCQHTLKKDMTWVHIKFSSPIKGTEHVLST